jgi:phage terminase large subunit-like protein
MNSAAASLASLSASELDKLLQSISDDDARTLLHDWKFWARPNQLPPESDWRFWLLLAGRGFGKTRVGGETIRRWVDEGYQRIHLVGPTVSDTRNVMVAGPSGLLSCFPAHQRPEFEPSKHLIRFHTGAVAETFSADEPERLRGPQCEAFWADECCSWRFLEDAWDNLMYGFRLPGRPLRGVISTTPKPSKWLKELMANPATQVTRGSSRDNRANLAPAFFAEIISKYEGTRLGRQEIDAEVLEDTPGALWSLALIDAGRWRTVLSDEIIRIVVGVDPAVSVGEKSADTGIVVAGLLRSGHVVVLDDVTCHETPLGWARVVKAAYYSRRADRVVGEINNGGDLVESNIRTLDPTIAFRAVRASRGKAIRAEPVAALYEQGRVHHVGSFGALESQMCSFVPSAERKQGDRLDRMDALVWAITELLIDVEEEPQWQVVGGRVSISRY